MMLDAMAMRVFKWDKLGSRLENKKRARAENASADSQ
jgi:hypothetical protein